ncbi:hypothetical protein BDW75DRAFT_95285 [Aspergillus navahoensis]
MPKPVVKHNDCVDISSLYARGRIVPAPTETGKQKAVLLNVRSLDVSVKLWSIPYMPIFSPGGSPRSFVAWRARPVDNQADSYPVPDSAVGRASQQPSTSLDHRLLPLKIVLREPWSVCHEIPDGDHPLVTTCTQLVALNAGVDPTRRAARRLLGESWAFDQRCGHGMKCWV